MPSIRPEICPKSNKVVISSECYNFTTISYNFPECYYKLSVCFFGIDEFCTNFAEINSKKYCLSIKLS